MWWVAGLTDPPYSLEVPSKQRTITRGWRMVESVDMVVVVRGSDGIGPAYEWFCTPQKVAELPIEWILRVFCLFAPRSLLAH